MGKMAVLLAAAVVQQNLVTSQYTVGEEIACRQGLVNMSDSTQVGCLGFVAESGSCVPSQAIVARAQQDRVHCTGVDWITLVQHT